VARSLIADRDLAVTSQITDGARLRQGVEARTASGRFSRNVVHAEGRSQAHASLRRTIKDFDGVDGERDGALVRGSRPREQSSAVLAVPPGDLRVNLLYRRLWDVRPGRSSRTGVHAEGRRWAPWEATLAGHAEARSPAHGSLRRTIKDFDGVDGDGLSVDARIATPRAVLRASALLRELRVNLRR